MTPTWYDLLGVEPDASADEIRAAWRAAIADLDPGDRRFRSLNQAAEVLLDPDRRAAYDATLDPDPEPEPALEPDAQPETSTRRDVRAGSMGWVVPGWLLAVAAVLAVLAVVSVGYLLRQPSDDAIAEASSDALGAAEQAMPVVLAYDFRELDADQEAAGELMTPDYRKDYDELFQAIRDNADATKPVVTASVVASGIIRAEVDRVQVLVLVDRQTTNVAGEQPSTTDQVRVTMERDGDTWLVDGMDTQPLPR